MSTIRRFLLSFAILFGCALPGVAQAQVTLSSTPSSVPVGGTATVSWSGIPSPTVNDWIGLYLPGAANNTFVTRQNTTGAASGSAPYAIPAGLVPTNYEFRLFNGGFALVATSAQFAVTLPPGSPTVTFTPATAPPGGSTISVSWSGIAKPTATDWIAIVPVGAANNAHQGWRYTTGTASGTVPFSVSSSVGLGNYQFRLFANNGYTLIGISDVFTVAYAPKTISGTVTRSGAALASITFSASGGGSCTASNASGQYTCTVPHAWSGTVTPSSGTYAFSPASRSYSNVTANQTSQDYAMVLVTVSGTVTTGGSPQAGVAFAATGGEACTTSNASGQYSCTVPQNWTGTVTPSFGLYVFSPASRSYSSIASNQTAQDYAATPPVSISGTVLNASSAPFAGATFTAATGGTCTQSNAAGQYSCQVPSGWSGVVTPAQVGRTFTPSSNSYTTITTNQSARDYATACIADSATIFYIQPDHLNTPRLVADANQQAVWKWDQAEPFGSNPADENPSALGVFDLPLRFPGQVNDKETNNHYNYYRDFDPSLGIYKQSDPIGLRGGLNTYAYVRGNPVSKTDPIGLVELGPFGDGQSGGVPSGPQNPAYQPQAYNRGMNPYEECMLDCVENYAKRQFAVTASIQGSLYGGLGAAAAAGQPGIAIGIQTVRQTMQRMVASYWPIGLIGYPAWWVTSCNQECECKRK